MVKYTLMSIHTSTRTHLRKYIWHVKQTKSILDNQQTVIYLAGPFRNWLSTETLYMQENQYFLCVQKVKKKKKKKEGKIFKNISK